MKRLLTNRRMLTLGLATAALTGGIAGPALATDTTTANTTATAAAAPAAVTQAVEKSVEHQFQLQETGYYCAPAATRVALTAQQHNLNQDTVADKLATTTDGTDSITQVTDTLNTELGTTAYTTVELPNPDTTDEQTTTFKADVTAALDAGEIVVANIVGTATDTNGEAHTYAGGHYIPIVGYTDNGDTLMIADTSGKGTAHYQIATTDMADWMATRGYTA